MKNTPTEVSAFIVVVLSTYRKRDMLLWSALLRAILEQTTVYFFILFTAQVYALLGTLDISVCVFHSLPRCTVAKLSEISQPIFLPWLFESE